MEEQLSPEGQERMQTPASASVTRCAGYVALTLAALLSAGHSREETHDTRTVSLLVTLPNGQREERSITVRFAPDVDMRLRGLQFLDSSQGHWTMRPMVIFVPTGSSSLVIEPETNPHYTEDYTSLPGAIAHFTVRCAGGMLPDYDLSHYSCDKDGVVYMTGAQYSKNRTKSILCDVRDRVLQMLGF